MADHLHASHRPGFGSLAEPRTVALMWVATAACSALFLALGWSMLQLGIALVPLLVVTIAMTVVTLRRQRVRSTGDAARRS